MADSISHAFASSLSEKKMLSKYLLYLPTWPINQSMPEIVLIAGHTHTLVNKLGLHRKSSEQVNYTVPQETV